MQSMTGYNGSHIQLCSPDHSTIWSCDSSALFGVTIATNLFSIILNLLQIALLSRVHELRILNFFWVVMNITIADILTGVALVTATIGCEVHHLMEQKLARHIGDLLTSIFIDSAFVTRYFLMGLACLERFYAVCKPHNYGDNIFVNNIGKCAVAVWLFCLAAMSSKHVVIVLTEQCIEDIFGNFVLFSATTMLMTTLPIICIVALLIKQWLEIGNMADTAVTEKHYQELRTASKYVTYSSAVLLIVIFLPSMVYLVAVVFYFNSNIFKWIIVLLNSVSGILNIVVYRLLYPDHLGIVQVHRLLMWIHTSTSVAPSEA